MTNAPGTAYHQLVQLLAMLALAAVSVWSWAQHSHQITSDPGFRPDNEFAAAFVENLDTATIAVYPSLVRRAGRTAVSFASREQIVKALHDNGIATAIAKNRRIDLGQLRGRSQWEVFEFGEQHIAAALQDGPLDTDYRLVMEFLLPVSDQEIFAVHCYIFDQQGRSAFSFLLNAHHQSFVDARLSAEDSSEAARQALIQRATALGMAALQAQIERAKICGTHTAAPPVVPHSGLIDGFEGSLPAGADRFGNALGFITFSDGRSTVEISTTEAYPPLPPKVEKNAVLRMDMNVTGWAGAVHVFENDAVDQWVTHDWSGHQELSFWFYGNNSGTSMFIDVLDNRKPCSTVDDAERYYYEFTDDFSGWERVTVRFAQMLRKDIGNGAPHDGLNLSAVHGWAIGALQTSGPLTFYIDDVDVRKVSTRGTDYPINERPMYGGLEKTAAQKRADKQYIKTATRGGRSREEAAEVAAQAGWKVFYEGDTVTAIKRFNQAWLLDSTNQHALWGFAVICGDRNEFEQAVRFFRMAIANGPQNPNLKRDYEFALKQSTKFETE